MKKSFLISLILILAVAVSAAQETVFSPDVYAARRAKLYSQMEPGSAVVMFLSSRYDNDIIYFTGVDVTGAVFIGVKDTGREYLFLPPFSKSYNVSSDEKLYPGEKAARLTGISETRDNTTLLSTIPEIFPGIHLLCHPPSFQRGQYLDDLKTPIDIYLSEISSSFPDIKMQPDFALFMKIRDIKEPQEIDKMRQAMEITGEAVIEAMRCTEAGMNEYHLEALFNFIVRRTGAKTLFHIIGSGPNSVILHHRNHIRDLQDGDLIVFDAGADVDHYEADITRTYPVSGRFSPEQREVYEIVLKANKACIAAARPGIPFQDLEDLARKIITDAGYGEFFNHSLGHPLNGGWDGEGTLQPGMIRTIEPGIYLPEKGFGIRIEDDILITEDGCLNLTAFVPKEIDEIENLMQEMSVFRKIVMK